MDVFSNIAEPVTGPVVRIWDKDRTLIFTLEGVDVDAPSPSRRLLTLPIAHPAAKWALDMPNRGSDAFLTIDGMYPERWIGPLKQWRTAQGALHTCPTCQQDARGTVIQTIWELPSFAPGWWPWT